MVRTSVLNDALNAINNAEKTGKRQVLIRPSSKVIVKFLEVMQKHGYIGEFEEVDDHRNGKIVIQLNGRLNKTGVISPRYNVQLRDLEKWVVKLLPSRQFGKIVLTTSAGIMDHEEARRKHSEVTMTMSMADVEPPRRIRALDEDVVNKIAAGEIIVAPVHALKELIENAVDAGATSVEILVKDGGLKLLQITDNGCGINKDDLPILCERFTTSKLQAFEDLTSIATYGFRGEALASISHIAHLSVTTKTAESSCAWKAHYGGGKLVAPKPGQKAEPRACAGRQGTQIVVEDLFFNVPTRKRAFRSSSEEYAKIAETVGKYAVHCNGVAFTCKKHGEAGVGIAVPAGATVRDRIRIIYSSSVANELIEFRITDAQYGVVVDGLVSNANYSGKRTSLLLFINHRSVDSAAVKRAVEKTYTAFLPKGGKPFIYLSLQIDPARVDVNVHPTKREVNILNEDEIIDLISDEIRTKLGNVDKSRTFLTQSLLTGSGLGLSRPSNDESPQTPEGRLPSKKRADNSLIRTDAKIRKITSMMGPSSPLSTPTHTQQPIYTPRSKSPVTCRLTTIKNLRAAVREAAHTDLCTIFREATFVGLVSSAKRLYSMQSGTKLYLVDYGLASYEYFYQVGLTDFGNFGEIEFSPALDLRSLLEIASAKHADTEGDVGGVFLHADFIERGASHPSVDDERLHPLFGETTALSPKVGGGGRLVY
ncbi:DNA mismatch repair protein MutL [Piedraia hortae CBS 480.64]|uniref:DNA mismatch repair protein MutL n=1 Tax=Piedraia hortae CBS 480.64 TaxID=1314780 RepID=A0A6A7C3W6_9PEZI|nr:DNA mismatch repair protein MutL [Piedraia hortae CBS 480.64]